MEEHVARATLTTPLGPLLVEATESTLCGIHFTEGQVIEEIENIPPRPADPSSLVVSHSSESAKNEVIRDTIEWLKAYFEGRETKKPSLKLPKDAFNSLCWLTAMDKIPFGHTVSYGELAEACGKTKAHSRAVGGAMAKNPFILLVPCHRVIRGAGEFGNYSGGGPNVKKWLLSFERELATQER